MISMTNLRKENIKLAECKTLTKMKQAGEKKMYDYLSGVDPDSSYSAENVKNIMTLNGDIRWEEIHDATNTLFSIGYSEQGNIIGILTNANALLQDMLVYCSLEKAKKNLKKVLSIGVGSKAIIGKRYAVNNKSPLSFALPVITKGGYQTYAVVIHNKHADQFINILETIDIDSLTQEDMDLIAKDISFISRTQELAIDVAKDKTIEIVDTSEWLKMGVKSTNYWLGKQDTIDGWYAKDNLSDIITAKKKNETMPDFNISKNIPEKVLAKVSVEVDTSESISREVLKKATEDYFNNAYKDMLTFSQETSLNVEAKSIALSNKDLLLAIKPVIMAYRSYMIDNIPNGVQDEETIMLLKKISKENTERFASVCRNTIYHLGKMAGYGYKDIAMIAYGTDLTEVSKDEGKFFRAIMPEEFKLLYSKNKTAIKKQKLFYIDELTEDAIDNKEEIIVDFINGSAHIDNVLIARTSYKFNASNCKLTFDETSGNFYAEQEIGIELPIIGSEILIRTNELDMEILQDNRVVKYLSKSPNNRNVAYLIDEISGEKHIVGNFGYRGFLDTITQLTIYNNKDLYKAYQLNKENAKNMINDYHSIESYSKDINIIDIITTNKDSEYEAQYIIINMEG